MADSAELTFKDLQMDERYKRLERTLKMALLKNAERQTLRNGNTSAWPSISSIAGDNLDMSCAAMSSRSSRIGSEVIASSSNLRNFVSQKKVPSGLRNGEEAATENQFASKTDTDRVMMPPPRMPGIFSGRPKRPGFEKPRVPLLNMPPNMDRKENAFAVSTPINSEPSVSHSLKFTDKNSTACFVEQKDYARRNYQESCDANQRNKTQERIFSRWRVLLNDKSQLIIKGTLECGKIARSKPVIRRLTATSVQSIFKHTYHLKGNLVDERNELPDYVSGKFYNGFPDDWENVYQVWRNFVSDGCRLGFRWPTPITDSDEDIKSGITELSYYPPSGKQKKSRSPRKRTRSTRNASAFLSTSTNKENQVDKNPCACSHTPDNLSETPTRLLEQSTISCPKGVPGSEFDDGNHKNQSMLNTTSSSLNSQRNSGHSLKDILQEDKFNLILDTLANKNCSLEYIQKIVEMLECMKFVISYQTSESDNQENAPTSVTESCTTKPPSQPMESNIDSGNNAQHSENQLPSASSETKTVSTNFHRGRPDEGARRKLSKEDYDSTESENDYYETRRRSSVKSRLHEKSNRYRDHKLSSLLSRPKGVGGSQEPEKLLASPESPSEDEFVHKRPVTEDPRGVLGSRKLRTRPHHFRGVIDNRDSSVSLTEEESEECYKPRAKVARKEIYDSSVSITEDERGEMQLGRPNVESLNYSPKPGARPVQPEMRRIADVPEVQKNNLAYRNEPNSSSINFGIDRPGSAHRISAKISTIEKPIPVNTDNQTNKSCKEQQKTSSDVSSEVKRQKMPSAAHPAMEPEIQSFLDDCSNEFQLKQNQMASLLSPIKTQPPKKKPLVIKSEPANIDIRRYNQTSTKNGIENYPIANGTARRYGDELQTDKPQIEVKNPQKNSENSPNSLTQRFQNIASILDTVSLKKSTNAKKIDKERETDETKLVKEKSTTNVADESSTTQYGSENKPKQLTGWVPAVICEDDDASNCRLVFEGKLLNEAGHVASRKFTTDFVERRINAKLVKTVGNVHYQLIGDLIDTKQVVPRPLVKLCRTGCPSNINRFCEKWKAFSSENTETPISQLNSTSVDSLSVPTSSRGRRILPPLNYWTGERVTTKDNQAVYSPGNCKELSITSSFDKSLDETREEKRSPKGHAGRSKKEAAKGSLPVGTSARRSPKKRIVERKLARKKHESSSGSDEDEPRSNVALRKRKMRSSAVTKGETTSKRTLRNTSKNTASSQSLERSSSSPSDSFKKPAELESKLRMRKRQKVNQDEAQTIVAGPSRQLTTRTSSGITCAFYKNVPLHNDDLSEDQLSTR